MHFFNNFLFLCVVRTVLYARQPECKKIHTRKLLNSSKIQALVRRMLRSRFDPLCPGGSVVNRYSIHSFQLKQQPLDDVLSFLFSLYRVLFLFLAPPLL